MKLQLNHLVHYLPYGLMCQVTDRCETTLAKLSGCYSDNSYAFFDTVESEHGFDDIKPVLRPMTDLTSKVKYLEFLTEYIIELDPSYSTDAVIILMETYSKKPINMPFVVVQKLTEMHFDVFGLIPNGLAIDINTIKS